MCHNTHEIKPKCLFKRWKEKDLLVVISHLFWMHKLVSFGSKKYLQNRPIQAPEKLDSGQHWDNVREMKRIVESICNRSKLF